MRDGTVNTAYYNKYNERYASITSGGLTVFGCRNTFITQVEKGISDFLAGNSVNYQW